MVRIIIILVSLVLFASSAWSQQQEPVPPSGEAADKDSKDSKKESKKEKKVGNPDDVPVIQPRKNTKPIVSDPPPAVAETTDQAVLPASFVKNRVESLKEGLDTYVTVDALRVDFHRKCWLHPHAVTGPRTSERVVRIKRDKGGFHVILERNDHQWEAKDVDGSSLKWIAVKTLTVRDE